MMFLLGLHCQFAAFTVSSQQSEHHHPSGWAWIEHSTSASPIYRYEKMHWNACCGSCSTQKSQRDWTSGTSGMQKGRVHNLLVPSLFLPLLPSSPTPFFHFLLTGFSHSHQSLPNLGFGLLVSFGLSSWLPFVIHGRPLCIECTSILRCVCNHISNKMCRCSRMI